MKNYTGKETMAADVFKILYVISDRKSRIRHIIPQVRCARKLTIRKERVVIFTYFRPG